MAQQLAKQSSQAMGTYLKRVNQMSRLGTCATSNHRANYISQSSYSTEAPKVAETVQKGVVYRKIPARVALKQGKEYYWCSCGLSKKQPFCDGTHKNEDLNKVGLKPIKFVPDKDGKAFLCNCKQTSNRPYCDLTHVGVIFKSFVPKALLSKKN